MRNRLQSFLMYLSAGTGVIAFLFIVGTLTSLEVALLSSIILLLASFFWFYRGDISDIKSLLRNIGSLLEEMIKEQSGPEEGREEKTSGGAFFGMIVGGALGLAFGPGGVIAGGVIGAILGNLLEAEEIKRRRREREILR